MSVSKVILWNERVICISHSDWTDQTKFRRKRGQLLILSKSNLLVSYFLLIFLLYSYSYNYAVCYVVFKMPCFRQKIRCDRLTVEMPQILNYNPLFSDSQFATSSVVSPPPTHPPKMVHLILYVFIFAKWQDEVMHQFRAFTYSCNYN